MNCDVRDLDDDVRDLEPYFDSEIRGMQFENQFVLAFLLLSVLLFVAAFPPQ
jgi:hypothetical protein